MAYRKVPLTSYNIYHIYTRSISEYKIFSSDGEYERMLETISFYVAEKPPCKFSSFIELTKKTKQTKRLAFDQSKKIVDILAYCLMPTHMHLILHQLKNGGISWFINLILKSYSKHFNLKHNRKGPLWEGRFKNVLVKTDEQLLHLSRYIHLNPTTAFLVNKPENWRFSSYREWLGLAKKNSKICNFSDHIKIDTHSYRKFVNNQTNYQRELAMIKNLIPK